MTTRYFTTPLYYVNARPHLGHAFTTILGDVMKRHYRQRGDAVTLLTGTDEHGDKIAQVAAKNNITPQAWADEVSAEFKKTWQDMNLDFDIFYRTTDPKHVKAVQKALQILKDKGDIEFREFEGKYCVGCERFYTETELGAEGLCPDHKTKPETRKESNYFFLMSRYQQKLIDHFEKNQNSIRPEHFRNEMLSFLKQPLGDLCISRPKERLQWGIEIPFDDKFVTYVWVDALTNYLAATGWPDADWNRKLWASSRHLIAKDILKTHAIYWTALLMAWDVPPFAELNVHGYWLIGGDKMSKSLGNVIRPIEVESIYGRETLRYTLLREMTFGLDASFTLTGYVNCVNAYLANGIGNLASRVLTLCQKGFEGSYSESGITNLEKTLLAKRAETLTLWNTAFEELKPQNALKAWSDLVTAVDLYVNETKPWALAKAAPDDATQKERLTVVLGVCCEVLTALGALIWPILPEASCKLLAATGAGEFDLKQAVPPLSLITETRHHFKVSTEVPKLFARVTLPATEPDEKIEQKKKKQENKN